MRGNLLSGATAIAEYVGVEERPVYGWADMPEVPVFRIGTALHANKADLETFFCWEAQRGEGAPLPDVMHAPLAQDLARGAAAIAHFVGVPERTIYHWADLADVPVFRVRGALYARRSELEAFLSYKARCPTQLKKDMDPTEDVMSVADVKDKVAKSASVMVAT